MKGFIDFYQMLGVRRASVVVMGWKPSHCQDLFKSIVSHVVYYLMALKWVLR